MLSAGDRINARYVVLEALGRGGMGEVYRARDTALNREVAVKLLRVDKTMGSNSGDSTGGAERLVREARTAASLEHANIIAIYDVGEVREPEHLAGAPYLAMELVRGKSLRARVGDESASLADRVRWSLDVARALAAAHAKRVVHRDIKPENVLLREDGVVKVVDFGIAKRTYGSVETTSSTEGQIVPTMTTGGAIMGTPLYMAPEQMRGENLDGRADQFSWAVMTYELLCGKVPWDVDGDALKVVSQVLSKDPPSPASVNPKVSKEISTILMRALAKAPADRFPSMSALVEELEPLAIVEKPETTRRAKAPAKSIPPASEPRRRLLWGALAAAAAVSVIFYVARTTQGTTPASSSSAQPSSACKTNADCASATGAICRREDGRCVALASEDCKVLAEPSDLKDDRTVWLGVMFPMKGPDAAEYGESNVNAVELGRRDLAQMMSGFRADPKARVRPVALVACDDTQDASRAARHLAEELRVPAVIGFRTSTEAIELSTSVLLPQRVLTMSALNTSPLISKIPQPLPDTRLVWRTTYSSSESAVAAAAFVGQVLEPKLVARSSEPIHVALLREADAAGLGLSHALVQHLRFNGKGAVENADNFREWTIGAGLDAGNVLADLAAFAPQIVICPADGPFVTDIVRPLERMLRPGAPRPTYLSPTGFSSDIFPVIDRDQDLRRRVFATTTVSNTLANARFVARYNEVFNAKLSRTVAPNSSYDAFYVLAYAAYAVPDAEPVTGPSLARGIRKLTGAGPAIDVGPERIFEAYDALRSGREIDLNGATSGLDFDPATGDVSVDHAVLCVGVDPHGKANDAIESGLVYSAKSRRLEGAMRCP